MDTMINQEFIVFLNAILTIFSTICLIKFAGYFALWAMVVSAIIHAGLTKDTLMEKVDSFSSYTGLLICAVVMIVATSFEIAGEGAYYLSEKYRTNSILMLCVACFSVVLMNALSRGEIHCRKKQAREHSS